MDEAKLAELERLRAEATRLEAECESAPRNRSWETRAAWSDAISAYRCAVVDDAPELIASARASAAYEEQAARLGRDLLAECEAGIAKDARIAELEAERDQLRERVRELEAQVEHRRQDALAARARQDATNELLDAIAFPKGRDFERAWDEACLLHGRSDYKGLALVRLLADETAQVMALGAKEGERIGREDERKAVVAWLRGDRHVSSYATCIERGEHRSEGTGDE